jgi:hypothetical protein
MPASSTQIVWLVAILLLAGATSGGAVGTTIHDHHPQPHSHHTHSQHVRGGGGEQQHQQDNSHSHGHRRRTIERTKAWSSAADVVVVDDCGFDGMNPDPSPATLAQEMVDMQAFQTDNNNKNESQQRPVIAVPTYFHLIQERDNDPLASDSRVYQYLHHLNDAFLTSNTPFTFVLQDITRTVNAHWSNNGLSLQQQYKRALKVGGRDSLNIYLCRRVPKGDGTTNTLAGFAYLPSSNTNVDNAILDGVVLQETHHGDEQRLGTLVHETGHCTFFVVGVRCWCWRTEQTLLLLLLPTMIIIVDGWIVIHSSLSLTGPFCCEQSWVCCTRLRAIRVMRVESATGWSIRRNIANRIWQQQ